MKRKSPLKILMAVALSFAMLLSLFPTSVLSAFAASASNVTVDVTNANLSATSNYPVSLEVSGIEENEFESDTQNLIKKTGTDFEVTDRDGTSIPIVSDNRKNGGHGGFEALTDGIISTGNEWYKGTGYYKEENGIYYYPYWYTYEGFKNTNNVNPEGYVTFTLDKEYAVDDFYIISAAFRLNAALSSYEVYFGNDKDTLYSSQNLATTYTYTGSTKLNTAEGGVNAEGQIWKFSTDSKPSGQYMGIKVLEGGTIVNGWLFLSEVGIHGTEVSSAPVDATIDTSALNDETILVYGDDNLPKVGKSWTFSVEMKNKNALEALYADGKEIPCANGEYTIAEVSDGMKITAKTKRDNLAATNGVWNGIDLTKNSSMYNKPIWNKDVTYNDIVMFYKGRTTAKMLYPIDDIISVRSYDMKTVYWRGEDFEIVNGEIVLTDDTAIPVYATPEDLKNKNADGTTNWGGIGNWQTKAHKYQIYVTYTHSKEWEGTTYSTAPASQIGKLDKFYEKISSGEKTQIVFYGDSITVGCNASGANQPTYQYTSGADASKLNAITWTMYGSLGLSSIPDWACDTYPIQVTNMLKEVYKNDNIEFINKAIGSTASGWGSKTQNLDFLIGDTEPDLFFLGYGMNEAGNSAATQNANTRTIINYVRRLNPDCSIVLVSAFYPNIWDGTAWTSYKLSEQEQGYYELMNEYDNLIVAPVYSVYKSMLIAKESCDYTSNLFNHPNDFGARVYADTIMSVLTPCQHPSTEVVGKKAATCKEEGYTGDTKCKDCGEIIKAGEVIPKDASKHLGTTKTVGAKAATCTAKGYTGDKVCADCGAVLEKGKETPALGHKLTTKTTKATLSANGKIVTSCTVCKAVTSTKTISRIKTVKLSTTSYTYSGSSKKPSVTVKDYSGKTLKNGTDYTVSYKNNKSVGTATATVTFKGNYQGSKKLTFTIKPKTTSLSKLTAGKKQLKVTWKKNSAVSGYEIQYSTSKKFSSAKTVTVKGYKTTSKTIKSLKAKKTYYVRIRTYKTVNGKKVYSDWSAKSLKKATK